MEEGEQRNRKIKIAQRLLVSVPLWKRTLQAIFEEQETKILEVEKTINKTIFEMKTHVPKPEYDVEIGFNSSEFSVSEM